MAERDIRRMTIDEFLAWDSGDDLRYELVDGMPRAMTGARRAHDRVVVNALASLHARLRGSPCAAHTADLGVRTSSTRFRRPDVTVDCGPNGPDDLEARHPVFLIEVLSPSTMTFDRLLKVIEYKMIPSVQQILLLDTGEPFGILHGRRDDGSWQELALVGGDTVVDLWSIGVSLLMSDFYDPAP